MNHLANQSDNQVPNQVRLTTVIRDLEISDKVIFDER
jgi:hypothetical protein